MSRLAFSKLSQRPHHRSVVRTLGALAVAAGLSLVGCTHDVTEPASAPRSAAEAKPLLSVGGASVWNGRIVSFMSVRHNSANQAVCLDIPWGVAFSGQDVNYFPCHFGPAQQFVITAWDAPVGSWAMIRPVSSSAVCLDMRGGTTTGGEHLQLFTCKAANSPGSANQIFKLPPAMSPPAMSPPTTVPPPQGLMTVICPAAGYPNLALEVPLPVGVSSFVQQHAPTGADNQWWFIRDAQAGKFLQAADVGGSIWRFC